jgi:hypothetical protein
MDTNAARATFSRDAYCPLERTSAASVTQIPTPPPKIAADPARLAMWQAEAEAVASTEDKHVVAVRGCGEQAMYSCWDVGGLVPGRRRNHWETIGVVCQAAPASTPPAAP